MYHSRHAGQNNWQLKVCKTAICQINAAKPHRAASYDCEARACYPADYRVLAGAVCGATSGRCRVGPTGLLPPPWGSPLHDVRQHTLRFRSRAESSRTLLQIPELRGYVHRAGCGSGRVPGSSPGSACQGSFACGPSRRSLQERAPDQRQSRSSSLQHRLSIGLKASSHLREKPQSFPGPCRPPESFYL